MFNFKSILTVLFILSCAIGSDNNRSDNSELILYLTQENVLFVCDGGFSPIDFYKNINGECTLYSLSDRMNRGYKGIYNNENILFCNSQRHYTGKSNFRIGDTLIPISAVCDSLPEILQFIPDDYYEKNVNVKDYIQIMLCHYRINFTDNEFRFNLIVNPALREFNLVDSIEAISNHLNYKIHKTIGTITKADEWIDYNYPFGDMIDSHENDSILKDHYDRLRKARKTDKNKRIKCCAK